MFGKAREEKEGCIKIFRLKINENNWAIFGGSSGSSLLFFFFKSRCGDKCVKEERLCDGGYMWIERNIV